jgi:hypothetical protein
LETKDQLLARLRDQEDQLVERKLEGAGGSEFKRQIVAFANTLPTTVTGVLFVGVADGGSIIGVTNPDVLQRTLRHLAENECYPAIWIDLNVLTVDTKNVVAAVVGGSERRPHFAGAAYIRRGSETIRASDSLYEALLLSRDEKRRAMQEMEGKRCTVVAIGKQFGSPHPMQLNYSDTRESTVKEVTAFFVRFDSSGTLFTETLESLAISYDDRNQRPMIIVRYPGLPGVSR